ncbi:MAG TPA: RHS repeat domain-containing protein, partial [Pyrinomonadaceae bacterium]|nr:RHS repeat domain-containing protein [Pyrinomonadaceae bacterium]
MPALKIVDRKYARILASLITMLTIASCALAQESSQFDKGTPPQHAAGVSPLGSYTSSDLGTINLSNGALNMKLPLASVGGRGFSLPLTLNYSSKVWSASRDSNFADETGNHPVAYAEYADIENLMDLYSRVAPGWTIGAAPTLVVRGNGIKDNTASICSGDFRFALTKLTVILPDKGEIQLRDDATNGAPLATQVDPSTDCMARDRNRGQRWHASDGSGIVFVSDTANGIVRGDLNGVLILSDGTRYRFASLYNPPSGSPPLNLMSVVKLLARSTSITDRNGNRISITYPSANEVHYTDQLGRITKIQKNAPDPANPSVTLAFLVTVPGYQGQNRYFKIKSAVMNQRYRPGINPTLPVINGDYDPLGWGLSWGTATRLFPFSHGLDAERIDVRTVMSELVLPDGRAIEFFYNEFGEVAEVRLPTGGKLQYDYQYVNTLPAGKSHIGEVLTSHFQSDVSDIERSVVARRTYPDGATLEGSWSYTYTNSTAQVTASSASGTVLLNQKHYFMARQRYLNSPSGSGPITDRGTEGTGYSLWSTGVSSRVETLDAAGTSVIAASEEDWTQRTSINWSAHTTYAQEQPENDNRVNQTRRYLENGMMAKTETFYDQYNNPIEIKEYDYNQILKRRTVTSYLSNYQTDDSIHLLSLPETTTVFNELGTQVAQSTSEYDVYTDDGNHRPLTAYGSVSHHDSNYGVSKLTRGNVTRIGQWLNTSGTFIYTYPRFDVLGNVVSTKDANGKVTTISFADDFGPGQNPGTPTQNPATPTYALPTLITSPPPLPGAPVHTARSQYDYSTGLLTGFRDRNDTVTQTIYTDPFNRPTQVKAALNVDGVETHVSNYYAPATVLGITLARNDVLTVSDLNDVDDASIRSWTVTDGFGRTKETWKRDPQGDVKVITVYDCLNRVRQTSNPFRPATESAAYTTTVYDLAGRVTSVTTPDTAVVNTSYSGNTVTVTDQAGKARKSVTDALGRLVEVYEDPNGVNWQTTYLYDALDNLSKVTQGSQQRFFMYNSLKRLIRARNPEQGTLSSLNLSDPVTSNNEWSIGYDYDSNGNLIKKTDARGVESIYAYDALNRNTTINYTDTLIDPDVKWFYDGAENGIGRFWHFYKGGDLTAGQEVDHTAVDSYDALGRPKVKRQLFKSGGNWSQITYQIERTYNRAGGVEWQEYPSQHSVTYNYDVAGRLGDKDPSNLAFKGNLG